MKCKNCNTKLETTTNFCPQCGGKIINNRLTVKMVVTDFMETYLSWDSAIIKTVKDLILQPDKVVLNYINGVRKRYVPPFSLLLFALTVYGIYMFISKDAIQELFLKSNETLSKTSSKDAIMFQQKINSFMLHYSNLFIFFSIPLTAWVAKIVFKTFNFIEHVIIQIYLNASYILVVSLINIFLYFIGVDLISISIINSTMMFLYFMFSFKKIFNLSIGKLLLKTLYFILLYFVFYLVIIIVISVKQEI